MYLHSSCLQRRPSVSSVFAQEEIQQFVASWAPAEQQDLGSLLDHIFTLSETRKVISSSDATVLDIRCHVGETAAKPVSPAKSPQRARPEKRQCTMRKCKAETENTELIKATLLSASPQKEIDLEEEKFELESPVLASFHSKQMSLETPMHWLFY